MAVGIFFYSTKRRRADLFISSGTIISVRGRHPKSHEIDIAESRDVGKGLPVIVLINGNSASSSEILAAGLQDSGRAIVIGSNSYGKGTVQTLNGLPNGAEFRVTWARFHAPSGYAIHNRGIIPNICTATAAATSPESIIAHLKSGARQKPPLRSTENEVVALETIKATCPQSTELHDLDIQIAESLLSQPNLIDLAKGMPNSTTSELIP